MILKFIDAEYPCTRAEKDDATGIVRAYDGDSLIFQATKVQDFSRYVLEDGDWDSISLPPSLEEQLRADVDFLAAMQGVTL